MLTVVITGSRDWTDEPAVHAVLAGADALIVGDCPTGADDIALAYARANDIIPIVLVCPAPRTREQLLARNVEIAKRAALYHMDGFDVQCHAFPLTGGGTWHCVSKLQLQQFSVQVHKG